MRFSASPARHHLRPAETTRVHSGLSILTQSPLSVNAYNPTRLPRPRPPPCHTRLLRSTSHESSRTALREACTYASRRR